MKRLLFYLPLIALFAACTKTPVAIEKLSNGKAALNAAPSTLSGTSGFRGLNWADPGDNFQNGAVVPSGLDSNDTYATTQAKAANIISGFQQRNANTIRLPVNIPSVLQSWWGSYTGAIDTALGSGMTVILCYWEAASPKNGLVNNYTGFWNMWQTIVNKYGSNPNVYFEVFNEPHGYSVADLNNLYGTWLNNYPSVPRNRIILDGAGYSSDVNDVGADSRFPNCLLSFHDYTWFEPNNNTSGDWEASLSRLSYPGRTIVTEFGIPMTNGKNYLGAAGTDGEITYFQGMTNRIQSLGMGCVYWPGLRNGDGYSLLTLSGTSLITNNASGLSRLQFAWGVGSITQPYGSFDPNANYKIICRNSNKALDVYNSSTANGGSIDQWDYWGGTNQQWKFTSLGNGVFAITNVNSGKALDVNGISTTAGASIIQWDYWGGANQQWRIVDMGFGYFQIINVNSGQSLDVNGASTANGAGLIQWYWSGNRNQQWQIVKL